jgi:hypothetical protein
MLPHVSRGEQYVPQRRRYRQENVAALDVDRTPQDLKRIDEIAPKDVAAGTRYPEAGMAAVNR